MKMLVLILVNLKQTNYLQRNAYMILYGKETLNLNDKPNSSINYIRC
jgi:hypothetical protein